MPPGEWESILADWLDLLYELRVPLLLLVIAVLVVDRFKRSFVAPIEYLKPSEFHGVPDVAPLGIQARTMQILQEVSSADQDQRHVVRIVVLTGRNTLHYLDQVVDRFLWTGCWDIRVLLADPDSPAVDHLGPGARDHIVASHALLAEMQRQCEARDRPVSISWRGWCEFPAMRGCILDEKYVLFGCFVWSEDGTTWRLHEQNKRFAYAKADDALGTDLIHAFKSWFDYLWSQGHPPIASTGDRHDESGS